MNRHNFLQFDPNCYKKHLSPFGCNVLDTLINHWRTDKFCKQTGFDNNESRRHHHFCSNQNRRNTRDISSYPRPIPSVPSSPTCDAPDGDDRGIYQATNFDSSNYLIPETEVQLDHAPHPSTASVRQDDYEKDDYLINHTINNDNFPMPRLPVARPSELTKSIRKSYDKDLSQAKSIGKSNTLLQQYKALEEMQDFSNVLPNIPTKQVSRADTHKELPNEYVLTYDDLAKTVEIANTNEEVILTANDIITPVINFNNINENLLSSTKKHKDKISDPTMPPKIFLELLNKETNKVKYPTRDEIITHREDGITNNVDWDDMFDTELFPVLKDPPELMLPEGSRENFEIEFPKDRKRKQNKISNRVTKPKTQIKSNKTLTKKIKKVTCEPRSPSEAMDLEKISRKTLRKEKYTKAVKNWLDGVDTNNLVDDMDVLNNDDSSDITKSKIPVMQEKNVEKSSIAYLEDINKAFTKDKVVEFHIKPRENITKKASEAQMKVNDKVEVIINDTNERNSKPKIYNETVIVKDSPALVIEKKPKAKSKKTVQTRLAEKDGKMKFGPPIKDQNESSVEPSENKEMKKVKGKFVPPIKSQIPVKNVTFDVTTINESNVHLIHDMINSQENDITMVVVYSNGFCQLNNHFTEETCVPEGTIIQSQEKFFYLKNNEQSSGLMWRIVEKSHIICYNGKRLLIYLISRNGFELERDVFNFSDAKIGASLLLVDPDNPPENFTELQKLLGFIPEYTIATECMLQKAAWYTSLLTECFEKLKSMLVENSIWNVFVEIEMPLLPVIAGMEYQGVCVDLEKIKTMEDILLNKMKAIEQECYKAAGKTFQINSTVQVRTILYDELQLDTKSNVKIKETIGKGAKSTSETMLRGLVSVHPLPKLILEYRHLHKAHATFLTGIAQHVKDSTVKPTWVQMAAVTGRIASNNPNLQAIPKAPFSLMVFPENSDQQEPTLNFRSVYTARPLHSLLAADFKHIECRVFAHAAEDAILQDALRSGQDLFRVLAAKWLNKPVENVSTEDRERTKRIVYASLYGAGARKLMEILHVSYDQALNIMTSFNRTFPALKSFGRAVVERATRGELRSLCGRARRFPHISSTDTGLRAQAERQAVNFVVQGSAADLCKRAMVSVQRRLSPTGLRCQLLLQIHDELVWEVANGDLNSAATIIKEAMENVGLECGMDMTLPVELTHGQNWGEMQPFSSCDFQLRQNV